MRRPGPSGRSGTGPVDEGPARPPGVTVLIPTYTPAGADRTRQLRLCLASVVEAARVAGAVPVVFVVADNGLTPAAALDVHAALKATGCPYLVVDAVSRSTGPQQVRRRYTAADARNAGLAALAAQP